MCGLVGVFRQTGGLRSGDVETLDRMRDRLSHRGPDAADSWADPNAGVALGHRRLSIRDLSAAGAQPMRSADGRWVIAYNGELYNTQPLRDRLDEVRGHSDTELLVENIALRGVEATLPELNGMFAFAAWDRETKRLHLVRDRLGIKPLYVGELRHGGIAFASEFGAVQLHPETSTIRSPEAITRLLEYGFIPAPLTISRGVTKLMPGEHQVWGAEGQVSQRRYWHVPEPRAANLSDGDALRTLNDLVIDAVGARAVSDVPLGAFLSGGVDSSLVAGVLQQVSTNPIRTYCVAFDDKAYDESEYAAAVAAHLGTDHTKLRCTEAEAIEAVPKLAGVYGEPFADASQLPTMLVCAAAKQHVTVVLSGDGGDESFGGYDRYVWGARVHNAIKRVPPLMRRPGGLIRHVPPATIDRAYGALEPLLPARLRFRHAGQKAHKLARLAATNGLAELYESLAKTWPDAHRSVRGGTASEVASAPAGADPLQYMTQRDLLRTLPADMLTKVDRASMAASLEVRVPLLDHRLVEFSRSLRPDQLVREGQGKWLLRRVLDRYVPRELIDRPKTGFSIPLADWLRGPLREWASDLLADPIVDEVDHKHVQALFRAHQDGRARNEAPLWSVLMLEQWARSA